MKLLIRLLCLTSLVAGLSLSAQTPPTSDDFSTDQRWQAISNAMVPKGGASTTITDGRMNYLVGTATADDAAGRYWLPSVGTTLSSWMVQIEVNLGTLGLTSGQYANLQIGASFGSHTFLNSIDRYHNGTTEVSGFEAYKDSTTINTNASSLTNATLRIGYTTATGGTLAAAFYDSSYATDDGLGVGYRVYANSTGILTSWSMGSGDKFNIILLGGSGKEGGTGPAISAGTAYFDNFASSSLEARAVPEPSTYAAIIGLLALGFAIYRRR